jgi:hypothetical protein
MQAPIVNIQSEKGSELSWAEADNNFLVLRDLSKNWVQSFAQPVHGLLVGDVVRNNQGNWVKAKADTFANASANGIVVATPDANTIVVLFSGIWTFPGHGYAIGQPLFLSPDTAGGIILEVPTTFQKPVGFAMSDSVVYVNAAQTSVVSSLAARSSIGDLCSQFALNGRLASSQAYVTLLWERGNTHTAFKHETGSYAVVMSTPMDDNQYSIVIDLDRMGRTAASATSQVVIGKANRSGTTTTTTFQFVLEKEIPDGQHQNFDSDLITVSIFGRKSA